MPVQLLTSVSFVPADAPGRWLARREAPTSSAACRRIDAPRAPAKWRSAHRRWPSARRSAVRRPAGEHVASPAKRMVAGEVPGMGLPAADRPALPLELADHVEHPWVGQPRANSRSEPGPTDRPLRAALACSRLVLCQVPQQNLGKP